MQVKKYRAETIKEATAKVKNILGPDAMIISTEKVKHIIEDAAALGCMKVRFTGGEPLLREDFETLYTYTRKLGIKVKIFTNAQLITPQLITLLKKIPPLDDIEKMMNSEKGIEVFQGFNFKDYYRSTQIFKEL